MKYSYCTLLLVPLLSIDATYCMGKDKNRPLSRSMDFFSRWDKAEQKKAAQVAYDQAIQAEIVDEKKRTADAQAETKEAQNYAQLVEKSYADVLAENAKLKAQMSTLAHLFEHSRLKNEFSVATVDLIMKKESIDIKNGTIIYDYLIELREKMNECSIKLLRIKQGIIQQQAAEDSKAKGTTSPVAVPHAAQEPIMKAQLEGQESLIHEQKASPSQQFISEQYPIPATPESKRKFDASRFKALTKSLEDAQSLTNKDLAKKTALAALKQEQSKITQEYQELERTYENVKLDLYQHHPVREQDYEKGK